MLVGLIVGIYAYAEGGLGGWEAFFTGLLAGVVTKYLIKWVLLLVFLYFFSEYGEEIMQFLEAPSSGTHLPI